MLMPIRTVSAIRIQQQPTPSKSPSEGDDDHQLSHENIGFSVLMKGRRIPPSGPSHRGNTAPIFTRHLLRKVDIL